MFTILNSPIFSRSSMTVKHPMTHCFIKSSYVMTGGTFDRMAVSVPSSLTLAYLVKEKAISFSSINATCLANFSGNHLSSLSKKRSEEHTSELQSRGHLVCRLLLEKKNYIYS